MKKINIVFPYNSVGGAFRSTYEICNRLKKLGYDPVVYFPFFPILGEKKFLSFKGISFLIRGLARSIIRFNRISWFDNDFPVRVIPLFKNLFIRDADFIIANHWQTAHPVYELSQTKGKKYYFIRDVEQWADYFSHELEAFKLNMKRLVVAPWIEDFLRDELSLETEAVITNGFNFEKFAIEKKNFSDDDCTISMIFSNHPMKAPHDGISVLSRVKKAFPKTKVILFGFDPQPDSRYEIDFEYEYVKRPVGNRLLEIYKKTDIFLCPSLQEGFHNPPSEAMAAKCCVVATNVGSVPYTIKSKENGFSVKPGDIGMMAKYISDLINNKNLRMKMANNGHDSIKNLTWSSSIKKLDQIFTEDSQ